MLKETLISRFDEYLVNVRYNKELTRENYISDINIFLDYLFQDQKNITQRELKSIKEDQIRKYIREEKKENNNCINTLNRKLTSIQVFYQFMIKENIVTKNVAMDIKHRKIDKKDPVFLTKEEMLELKNAVDKKDTFYLRNKCIIILLLNTGIRNSELRNLKLENIKGDILNIENSKRNKSRVLRLNIECKKALEEYIEGYRNNCFNPYQLDYLFLSKSGNQLYTKDINNLIKKLRKNANIDKEITCHSIRHSYLTEAYKITKDIKKVQKIAGHSSASTTANVYIHLADDEVGEAMDSIII